MLQHPLSAPPFPKTRHRVSLHPQSSSVIDFLLVALLFLLLLLLIFLLFLFFVIHGLTLLPRFASSRLHPLPPGRLQRTHRHGLSASPTASPHQRRAVILSRGQHVGIVIVVAHLSLAGRIAVPAPQRDDVVLKLGRDARDAAKVLGRQLDRRPPLFAAGRGPLGRLAGFGKRRVPVRVAERERRLEGVADLPPVPRRPARLPPLVVLLGERQQLALVERDADLGPRVLRLEPPHDVAPHLLGRLQVDAWVPQRQVDARLEGLVNGAGPVGRQEEDPRVVLELAQEDGHESVAVDLLPRALHEEHVGFVEEEHAAPLVGSGSVLFELLLDRLRLKPEIATSDGIKWTLGVRRDGFGCAGLA